MSNSNGTNHTSRHVAIIGGGIIGASTLYYLSRASTADPNLRATLIEESPAVAPGASGKSGGFLALDWHGAATSSLAALSFKLHADLAREHDGEKRWGYREVDTLSLSFNDEKVNSSKRGDKGPEWLDTQHVTKTSNMGGSGTTAQVTPEPLVKHLVSSATQNPAFTTRLGTRAEKVKLNEETGRVEGLIVKTADGSQETLDDVTDVVVAAGPWTGSLLKSLLPITSSSKKLPAFIASARHIDGSRAHSVVIRSSKPTTATCLFTEMRYGNGKKAGAPEIYCREDGTIYACGGSDDVPLPARAADVSYDPITTKTIVEQCAALSPTHLDTLTGAKATGTLEREQACYLPVQSGYGSGAPTVAGDAQRGLYVGAGHSCWGITLGPGTGYVLSELILGKKPSADLSSLG